MNHPDSETRSATHIGPRTLLELCLDLRMAANGSADPISDQETDEALAYLRYRIQHWAPSGRTEERFDEAVRALILATIAEVEERRLLAPIVGMARSAQSYVDSAAVQSPITGAAIAAAVVGARIGPAAPWLCEHANETPRGSCSCASWCSCREKMCRAVGAANERHR